MNASSIKKAGGWLRSCAKANQIEPASRDSLLSLSQRLPPSNLAAEQALLGALLANNKAYERVAEFLAPEHFADPVHGRILAVSRPYLLANEPAPYGQPRAPSAGFDQPRLVTVAMACRNRSASTA